MGRHRGARTGAVSILWVLGHCLPRVGLEHIRFSQPKNLKYRTGLSRNFCGDLSRSKLAKKDLTLACLRAEMKDGGNREKLVKERVLVQEEK